MVANAPSVPSEEAVLVIDEHGDRKWGSRTAHVGRQWLANFGKTDNGVVSVTSLWADERIYYPVDFEPYTPSHHFDGGKNDPGFRTKLKIARQLVERSVDARVSEHSAADLAAVVRLYGLRMWVEQSYKQVKHVFGFSDYQG